MARPSKLRKMFNDIAGISESKGEALINLTDTGKSAFSGVGGGPTIDPDPDFLSRPGDQVIKHKTSYISLGQARDGVHPLDEFGGPNSQEIRMVVGGGGPKVAEEDPVSGERMVIGPDPMYDGATFLLTTKTDHRLKSFGLNTDQLERLPTGFAGIKADTVAIVSSTEDLILATSTNASDHQDRKNWGIGRIILNAGNKEVPDDTAMQKASSVPDGEAITKSLEQLYEMIDELSSTVQALNLNYQKLTKELMNHVHYGFAAEPTIPSLEVQREGVNQMMQSLKVEQSLSGLRARTQIAKINNTKAGKNHPLSRHVKIA